MTYPPQLPAVLFSALSSVEGSPGRRPRRSLGTQTSQSGHRLRNPGTTQLGRGRHYLRRATLMSLVGVIALAVIVVLGVMLGDAEEGARGSLVLQPGSAAGGTRGPLPLSDKGL